MGASRLRCRCGVPDEFGLARCSWSLSRAARQNTASSSQASKMPLTMNHLRQKWVSNMVESVTTEVTAVCCVSFEFRPRGNASSGLADHGLHRLAEVVRLQHNGTCTVPCPVDGDVERVLQHPFHVGDGLPV